MSNVDKITLKFIADVLYLKGHICYEELEDIYDAKTPEDLDVIFDKMMRGEYNVYRKGESYGDRI